jgi:hypothetical protein
VELTRLCSPAAKRIKQVLTPFFMGLDTGRMIARVGGLLKKSMLDKGLLDYSYLIGYEVQPRYPLDKLLLSNYKVSVTPTSISVKIPVSKTLVKRHSKLVSHFYFELVLVTGLPDHGVPDADSTTSSLYAFEGLTEGVCTLRLPIASSAVNPYMLLLKLCSLEGNELAHHPRHYGMKVIATGR